jgi:hypothetical protein
VPQKISSWAIEQDNPWEFSRRPPLNDRGLSDERPVPMTGGRQVNDEVLIRWK